MVSEAEEFAEADKKVKGRVDARNSLETYLYNMRSTIDDKLGDKLGADEKATVRAASDCLIFIQAACALLFRCGVTRKAGCRPVISSTASL